MRNKNEYLISLESRRTFNFDSTFNVLFRFDIFSNEKLYHTSDSSLSKD